MLICPSSFSTLNQFLKPTINYQHECFNLYVHHFNKVLIRMNPLLLIDAIEEEKEINKIFQDDDVEQLKIKYINHLLDLNHRDKKEISLIEKSVLLDSQKCTKFLIDENVSIERRDINISFNHHEIGLMEYGSLKGNKEIIEFCLEKGQNIQKETLILGLIGHKNEIVEWLIEEGKKRNFFNDTIKAEILGTTENIEFNEQLLNSGIDINYRNDDKRRKDMEKQH